VRHLPALLRQQAHKDRSVREFRTDTRRKRAMYFMQPLHFASLWHFASPPSPLWLALVYTSKTHRPLMPKHVVAYGMGHTPHRRSWHSFCV
jgi:hypothetical protein